MPGSKVTEVGLKNDKFELFLNGSSEPQGSYDRVILALPKGPLEKIVHTNRDAFNAEKEISSLLDSAFAFPMVKLFVVVKNRWWEEDDRQTGTRPRSRRASFITGKGTRRTASKV